MHSFQPLFSDCHSKISVCIKASLKHNHGLRNETEKMPDSFKWNKYSSKRFIQSLKDKEINDKINLFIERKFDYSETDVENACSC